jgi:hypothetical protein
VWPLGRWTQSGGEQETHKSTFIFQLIKWYLEAGGLCHHIDTENKTSTSLMQAVIGHEYFEKGNPMSKRMIFHNATTVEAWQSQVSQVFEYLEQQEEAYDVARFNMMPLLVTIDSLMGSGSKENQVKMAEQGGEGVGRGYSDAPIKISNWLRDAADKLLGRSVTIHASHHEKKDISNPHADPNRAGGHAPGFYASLDVRFVKGAAGAKHIPSAYGTSSKVDEGRDGLKGRVVNLRMRKSSMGDTVKPYMTVPFLWYFDTNPETGKKQQHAFWDWGSATAMVLEHNAKRIGEELGYDINGCNTSKQKCGITDKYMRGRAFWSKKLGLGSADNPASAKAFGEAINANRKLSDELDAALNINHFNTMGDAYEPVEDDTKADDTDQTSDLDAILGDDDGGV